MAVQRHTERASLWGALFVLALVAPAASACPLDRVDETVRVAKVYDGDTVRLQDGRKVRFAGINTPEIDHDGGNSQPFARAAQRRVEELIGGGEIQLRYDEERKDRYGRLLAHPYLVDGRSLSGLLLDEGLAAVIAKAPNLWQYRCYFSRESGARITRRGIWSDDSLQKQSKRLKRGDEGFTLLQGQVEKVDESRHSLWLELEGKVALRIRKKHLHYFNNDEIRLMKGRFVEARGWLTYHKGKWRMNVDHPAALRVVDENNGTRK